MNTANIKKSFLTAALAMALITPSAFGQPQTRPGRGTPQYDRSTEVKVKGTVQEVKEYVSPSWGGQAGIHLILDTEEETFEVHLGPSSFIAEQEWEFAEGDEIEVTGSKVKYEGSDWLVAREVKKGDRVLTLRNAQGIPEWSGGKRR